jgi:hypothetical protein
MVKYIIMNKQLTQQQNFDEVEFISGYVMRLIKLTEQNIQLAKQERENMKKIEDVILFHKHKGQNEEVILLDENNTYFNIKLYIKNKYPNTPIQIINEGRGER